MNKIFAEIFSKKPDEIIDGDYFYHNSWYDNMDANALAQVAISLKMTPQEIRERYIAGCEKKEKSTYWDSVTFQGEFDPLKIPGWMKAIHEGNGVHKINKILTKIANEGKPFMDIASSESFGIIPLLLKMNPKISCMATDIAPYIVKCLRSRINRDLREYDINLGCFDDFDIPIKDNSLDYITSAWGISDSGSSDSMLNSSIDTLTVDKQKPIKEVYRILKPGGYFIAVERNQEWKFDLTKTRDACDRQGKLFGIYTYNEIEYAKNKLTEIPSWYDQFIAAGFQIEIEEKYPQKCSGHEIIIGLPPLTSIFKIREWTDDERKEYKKYSLSVNKKDFDKVVESFGIELFRGVFFYVLRKPN